MSAPEEPDDQVLFEEKGGLSTMADLYSVYGESPVRATVQDNRVMFTIDVSGGEVSAELTADRAEQLGEALIEGADRLREHSTRGPK